MKKILSIIILILSTLSFVGCISKDNAEEKKIKQLISEGYVLEDDFDYVESSSINWLRFGNGLDYVNWGLRVSYTNQSNTEKMCGLLSQELDSLKYYIRTNLNLKFYIVPERGSVTIDGLRYNRRGVYDEFGDIKSCVFLPSEHVGKKTYVKQYPYTFDDRLEKIGNNGFYCEYEFDMLNYDISGRRYDFYFELDPGKSMYFEMVPRAIEETDELCYVKTKMHKFIIINPETTKLHYFEKTQNPLYPDAAHVLIYDISSMPDCKDVKEIVYKINPMIYYGKNPTIALPQGKYLLVFNSELDSKFNVSDMYGIVDEVEYIDDFDEGEILVEKTAKLLTLKEDIANYDISSSYYYYSFHAQNYYYNAVDENPVQMYEGMLLLQPYHKYNITLKK